MRVQLATQPPIGYPEASEWDYDLTYEFYGTPIPEPSSLALAALGCGCLLSKVRNANRSSKDGTIQGGVM